MILNRMYGERVEGETGSPGRMVIKLACVFIVELCCCA